MRQKAIKKILFTLASFASLSAWADDMQTEDLFLMDELPVEQRIIVHKHVVEFLWQHPEIAEIAKTVAIDRKGVVYVLDEDRVPRAQVGAPSCISTE